LRGEFPDVEFVLARPDDLKAEVGDADALYGIPDGETFGAGKRLRWLAHPAVGIDYLMDRPDIVESDPTRPQPTNPRPYQTPPPQPHQQAPRFCTQCGAGLPGEAAFCQTCGAKL
jgi:hypothetical protein